MGLLREVWEQAPLGICRQTSKPKKTFKIRTQCVRCQFIGISCEATSYKSYYKKCRAERRKAFGNARRSLKRLLRYERSA